MHRIVTCLMLVLGLAAASQLRAQSEQARPGDLPTDPNVIARLNRAEGFLQSQLEDANLIVEGVIQRLAPSGKAGYNPSHDYYYLGRFIGKDRVIEDLLKYSRTSSDVPPGSQILEGILDVMVPDWDQLREDRYEYQFVELTLLGEMLCAVYDVQPRSPAEGFKGRIYVEERSWNIVRFTGVNSHADAMFAGLRDKNSTFHIDSWRMNIGKDRFVPALAYLEEVPDDGAQGSPLVAGQFRFWGYDQQRVQRRRESVTTKIVAAGVLIDGRTGGTPPHEAQRRFEKQAEENILDRLSKAKLLAPPGEVDGMCQQVINSLLASNHQLLGEPVQCRLLLTSRLEAFIVNNTIVVSRGFIDVLPDWSPLAFVLAHQLAHNILGHKTVDTKFAFADVLRIPDAELIGRLQVRHTEEEESEADLIAMKILKKSVYNARIPQAALFMDSLRYHASGVSSLLEPDFGEHIMDSKRKVRNDPSSRPAEVYDPENTGQLSALPLGSWLIVNPGTGGVEFSQLSLPPELKARERGDFTVKAFMPRLQYFVEKTDSPKQIVHRAASRKKQPTSKAKPTVKKNGSSPATGERASLQR
jgi:hypothetical protein